MPRDSAAARAAAAAAPPPPPPPAPAGGGAAPKAGGTAPKAPAAVKPKAVAPAAPKAPVAPAAPAAPIAPTAPAVAGERRYGAASPFGVPTLLSSPEELPRKVTRETELPLRMPEYEQRLARVREMRKGGKYVPAEATEFKVAPSSTRPARTITTAPSFGMDTKYTGAPGFGETERSRPAVSAPLSDTAEFARQAEQLGAKYAKLQGTLAELDQLRRKYESERALRRPSVGAELSRRNPLEVLAGRAPMSDADTKLREIAQRTRAANQETAQTIQDLKQYGFAGQEDVDRAFGSAAPAASTQAPAVPETLRVAPR